jgi:hypothetical protein
LAGTVTANRRQIFGKARIVQGVIAIVGQTDQEENRHAV